MFLGHVTNTLHKACQSSQDNTTKHPQNIFVSVLRPLDILQNGCCANYYFYTFTCSRHQFGRVS